MTTQHAYPKLYHEHRLSIPLLVKAGRRVILTRVAKRSGNNTNDLVIEADVLNCETNNIMSFQFWITAQKALVRIPFLYEA